MDTANPKVLLVDDDPAMLRLLSKWLQKAEYRVQQAGDGQQALAAIQADCPDLLITDWEMPHLDGLGLCREIRKLRLPHYLYILFLTVKSARDEIVAGLEVGADDFLTKPVDQTELLARMRAGTRVLALERRLSQMASTDQLTGLMTRRAFYEALKKESERSRRFRLPLSCVMMDIDFFKRINDTHGHPAGDAILKAVAQLVTEGCRTSDSVCRYGGEEFCVMLPETGEQDAAVWAERTRQHLASLVIPVGGKQLRITASFGIAQKNNHGQSPEELVDQADQALLCAKQSGRDRVVSFQSLSNTNDVDLKRSGKYGGLFRGITARHVMNPLVACLREDQTIGQAAEFFLRSRISSTPVVDANGKLAGILSEKDLLSAMVSLESWRRPIHELMRPNVICYEEDTPIETIYEFLCRVAIRRVVIANQGRPTGAISRGTLLRWFNNLVISKGLMEPAPPSAGHADVPPGRPFSGAKRCSTDGRVADSDLAPMACQPQDRPNPDSRCSKQRLAETARQLAQQASNLQHQLQQDADDLVPYVVGGATRMHDLVNDLLAFSRYANETPEAACPFGAASECPTDGRPPIDVCQ